MSAKLKLFHEEIMQEEGLKVTDLPKELQKKIRGFSIMKSKWENNPVNEKDFISLQKTAIKIGDLVQNFIEEDYDDEEEEEEKEEEKEREKDKNSNKPNTSKSAKKDDDDDDDDNDEKKNTSSKSENTNNTPKEEKAPKKPTGKFGNSMMEKKILAIMEAKGQNRIRISDLEAIIGREPDYPEQVVNNIKLRKVFLSSEYRLV